jgi:hypothetical protein
VSHHHRTFDRPQPSRNKRELELAALRLVVLTGMLAAGAVILWPHLSSL